MRLKLARMLELGVRTVDSHRQHIRRKRVLDTQTDLVKDAVEHSARRFTP